MLYLKQKEKNKKMILNVSGRTDIVAFYSKWFMNRYQQGYVDVRNPFYPQLISRIFFEDVELIVFCTKNPWPILPYLEKITQKIIFHVTLTPYHKEIEPNVEDKKKIIEGIKKVSKIVGKENTYLRYDPIFLNEKYTVEYHIKAFTRIAEQLKNSITHVIISFLDEYKNVKTHAKELKKITPTDNDYEKLAKSFSEIAQKHGITIQTCHEKIDLERFGISNTPCISQQLAYQITGKKYKKWQARKCNCVEMVDIGSYNTCPHLCKYCYANYDEKAIRGNIKQHDPNSSLLIGHIQEEDIIKRRQNK